MAAKFGRNYILTVDPSTADDPPIVITPESNWVNGYNPFSMEFDIQRHNFSGTNSTNIKIYNLSSFSRGQIWKSQQDFSLKRNLVLQAGYGTVASNLPIVFSGQLRIAWSFRENVDVITQMESLDGSDAAVNGFYTYNYAAGTTVKKIANDVVTYLKSYGISSAVIGNITGSIQRGNTFSGQAKDVLQQIFGNKISIQNGVLHILGDNECTADPTLSVTEILATPLQESGYNIMVETLFEPNAKLNQQVNLNTTVAPYLDGTYKIISISHKGLISPVKCGEARTILGLLYAPNLEKVAFS